MKNESHLFKPMPLPNAPKEGVSNGKPTRLQKHLCPYCGQTELIAPDYIYRSQIQADITSAGKDSYGSRIIITNYYYQCALCGACISDPEFKREMQRLKALQQTAAQPQEVSESQILDRAEQLMQKYRWEEALDLLFQQAYPYEHPLEFLFCRSICQLAPFMLYPRTKKQAFKLAFGFGDYHITIFKQRYEILDPLLESLKALDYYLPQDDPEKTFAILKHLYEALLLLGGLPFKSYSFSHKSENYIDYTHHKRLAIITSFTEILRSQADSDQRHYAEYLKMIVYLLNECLTVTLRKKGKLEQISLEQYAADLNIYNDTYIKTYLPQIDMTIKHLSEEIAEIDPNFRPILSQSELIEEKNAGKESQLTVFLALAAVSIILIAPFILVFVFDVNILLLNLLFLLMVPFFQFQTYRSLLE